MCSKEQSVSCNFAKQMNNSSRPLVQTFKTSVDVPEAKASSGCIQVRICSRLIRLPSSAREEIKHNSAWRFSLRSSRINPRSSLTLVMSRVASHALELSVCRDRMVRRSPSPSLCAHAEHLPEAVDERTQQECGISMKTNSQSIKHGGIIAEMATSERQAA